jgi:hypothetical protein
MTEQALWSVIKMQSKSRFQLESLSRSLPRAVLYQLFFAFKQQTQKPLFGQSLTRILCPLWQIRLKEWYGRPARESRAGCASTLSRLRLVRHKLFHRKQPRAEQLMRSFFISLKTESLVKRYGPVQKRSCAQKQPPELSGDCEALDFY